MIIYNKMKIRTPSTHPNPPEWRENSYLNYIYITKVASPLPFGKG